jgi:SHOCT-like domain
MSDETRRILDMLAQGKVTVDEADQLLAALNANAGSASATAGPAPGASSSSPETGEKPRPRYLRIAVQKTGAATGSHAKDVTIRVPLGIIKSGVRLGAVIPAFASERAAARMREKGLDVDLSKLDAAAIDAMLNDFGEMDIDVDGGTKKIRISCE